jgi:hypothetical protein
MTKLEKKADKLEARRKRLLEDISDGIAHLDDLEEMIAKAKERDPLTEQRQKEVKARIGRMQAEYREVTKKVARRRKIRHQVTEKYEDVLREIKANENTTPKIVDLNLQFRPLSSNTTLSKTVGHYTAGPVDRDDADCERLCRQYHAAHLANNWAGEGYHYCISRKGTIFLLRPAWAIGAHTLNHNTGSIGVMMNGTTGDKPTRAQARSLRWLLANAHTDKMPSKGRVGNELLGLRMYGHLELGPTACPGDFLGMYKSKGRHR